MPTVYDLNKIKVSTDEATFQRGVDLYENNKVSDVEEAFDEFTAVVYGTKPYCVSVSARRYKDAHCTCYLGERGTLCKHIVALAIYAVMDGQPLKDEDKQPIDQVKCSDKRETLSKDELTALKKSFAEALRYIKPYHGPSRTWFANQDSLQEGTNRLRMIISKLPVNRQSADSLIKLLLRLEHKLSVGGVDDSNGIVGCLVGEIVALLEEFARIDPSCIDTFKPFCKKEYCFGWEDPLVRLYDERVS